MTREELVASANSFATPWMDDLTNAGRRRLRRIAEMMADWHLSLPAPRPPADVEPEHDARQLCLVWNRDMKMTHTPGPWTFKQPWAGFSAIHGPTGELIFGIAAGGPEEKQPDEVCEANALLIQAAPELLAALERALNYIEATESEFGITLESGDIARAAIAKARKGETT